MERLFDAVVSKLWLFLIFFVCAVLYSMFPGAMSNFEGIDDRYGMTQ